MTTILTGGWLEEYIFCKLYQLKGKGITDVCLNLFLKSPKGATNEFDIMFTYENALYFVECKSLNQEHDPKLDSLYKIGALQTDFGLRIKSFLATQSEKIFESSTSQIKQAIMSRAKQMNTIILPLTTIEDPKQWFQESLKMSK